MKKGFETNGISKMVMPGCRCTKINIPSKNQWDWCFMYPL